MAEPSESMWVLPVNGIAKFSWSLSRQYCSLDYPLPDAAAFTVYCVPVLISWLYSLSILCPR